MRIVDTGTIRQVQSGDPELIGVTLLVPPVDQVLRRTIGVGTIVHGKGATTIGTRLSGAGSCRTTMTTRPAQLEVPARTGKTHQDPQAAQANRLTAICVTNHYVALRSLGAWSVALLRVVRRDRPIARWRPMT
jgi:hypothetical protein